MVRDEDVRPAGVGVHVVDDAEVPEPIQPRRDDRDAMEEISDAIAIGVRAERGEAVEGDERRPEKDEKDARRPEEERQGSREPPGHFRKCTGAPFRRPRYPSAKSG